MSVVTDEVAFAALGAFEAARVGRGLSRLEALRAALEVAMPYLPPVASRERVAEVLYLHDHRNPLVAPARWDKAMTLSRREYLMRADSLLAAGVFSEPEPECGAVDRTGQRRCVFTPGHHEVEDWTSHGDRGGWTWNDQPKDES